MSVRVTPGPVGTPSMLQRADEVQTWRSEQLDAVRTAAEKWRVGLAGVIGLVTVVAVIKGRESLVTLRMDFRIAVGVCLLLALVSSAAGSYWGMRAAYGMPRVRAVARLTTAPASFSLPSAARAVLDLTRTIRCTYLTLLLLVAAVGLTWYGPPTPPAFVSVSSVGGVSACGRLVTLNQTHVSVAVGAQLVELPTGELRSVILKQSC